ncbi:hypothetical protein pb186bvf_001311 [Paramecium bursaria]
MILKQYCNHRVGKNGQNKQLDYRNRDPSPRQMKIQNTTPARIKQKFQELKFGQQGQYMQELKYLRQKRLSNQFLDLQRIQQIKIISSSVDPNRLKNKTRQRNPYLPKILKKSFIEQKTTTLPEQDLSFDFLINRRHTHNVSPTQQDIHDFTDYVLKLKNLK